MSVDMLVIGDVEVSGVRVQKYSVEIRHKGLKEHKIVSSTDFAVLKSKAQQQIDKWSEKWDNVLNYKDSSAKTEDATSVFADLENILVHTLSVDDRVNWNKLKRFDKFDTGKPGKPEPPFQIEYPRVPLREDREFQPTFSLLEKVAKPLRDKKIAHYESLYRSKRMLWEDEKEKVDTANKTSLIEHEKAIKDWEKQVLIWEEKRKKKLAKQEEFNNKIEQFKELYLTGNQSSVEEYCELVLSNSQYSDFFPKSFQIEYNSETKILIVEYELPCIDSFPRVKEVKYIASKKETKEILISESQLNKLFDDVMYKVTLRTLHELFEADVANAIESIAFNGWIRAINKATGKEETNCILSIQVLKKDFLEIDLAHVDPKLCFKSLKGVASSKLSSITPIKPVLQIDKSDSRFVAAYDVVGDIDDSTNLAAMNWEDFEHLIRELFEKEFRSNGGEVKITQASRDGGVDAVAFDPDPIRGGKIVIQAKRYTNTVGVSAVRDLYGTVMNEGATKGILVSTSDYGPDAYDFAKGKPLTLLNGGNLLHLLEKHGHHAKIDIKEAKRLQIK